MAKIVFGMLVLGSELLMYCADAVGNDSMPLVLRPTAPNDCP